MSLDKPIFLAVLTPYRSLTRRGFHFLMLGIGLLSLAMGSFFLSIGAWPVFGFFGLDVLILYVAFRRNFASARISETVEVTPAEVVVTRRGLKGRVEEDRLNAYWARLFVEREPDEGVTGLAVGSHGRRVPVGDFLNPPDRESFADALGAALATVRRGIA
jgi:uncharacterized membrane protein